MRITFLGTGTSQGIPVVACLCEVCQSSNEKDKRLRSAVLIENEGLVVAIDCGPDFRYQMLREHVQHLDAVVFTHSHRDHTAGLDEVRAFNFSQEKDMDIYADAGTLKVLHKQFDYVFSENPYPGTPKVREHEISLKPFTIQTTKFLPIQVMHYQMPVLGFRIKDFTYITDANYISPDEKKKLYGTKILVLNALRIKEHISHFTLSQAIELVEEIQPDQAYFTHISHQLGLHGAVSAQLPPGIFLAYDGLRLEL